MPSERNHNSSSLVICLVKIVVEVKTSVFSFADIPFFVQDKGEMSSNSALVD